MQEKRAVEVIARGVCIVDGKILLCYGRKSGISYLPGGHVEFGETAREALVREIREEMGCSSRATTYLGTCEHQFFQQGEPHTEINLLFTLEIPALTDTTDPAAEESWIGFRWVELAQLQDASFQPDALIAVLPQWIDHPGGHLESQALRP